MRNIRDKAGNNPDLYVGTERSVVTAPVVGDWVLFTKASAGRDELSCQNLSAGDLYFTSVTRNAGPPANGPLPAGSTAWQLHIPADPAFFVFPQVPSGDVYVRSSVASATVSVIEN